MINQPTFMISLDVEMGWGFIGKRENPSFLTKDSKAGREAIDILLGIFERCNIPATWAIVGHLFLDHCEKDNGIPHKDMPRYKDNWYSRDPCTNICKDPLYYGKDIVEKIVSSLIEHEIGYHSFSHIDFSKCRREVAEAEIRTGVRLANKLGIKFKSFVFPYNKVGHVDVLKENRFEIYRGRNLERWDIDQGSAVRRINGIIDKMTPPSTTWPRSIAGIWGVPSSMGFFVSDPVFTWLLTLRGKMGILRAIHLKKIFHIFLHPWNIVENPALEEELERFLVFASGKRQRGKLCIITMGELASRLNKRRKDLGLL